MIVSNLLTTMKKWWFFRVFRRMEYEKIFYPHKFIYVLFIALSLMLQTVAEAAVGKCSGGASDGSACISDEDCPGGTCIGVGGGLPGTCGPWNCAPEEWTVTAIGHETTERQLL